MKHCWCTPQGILDILKKHDSSNLHKKECSEAANFDFEQPGPRRLRQDSQPIASSDEDDDALDELEELDGQDAETPDMAEPRRLTHNSRRRRTYSYTPWALVSVPKTDTFDSLEGDSPESDKQISCAYQYGVPAASSNIYQSDGPYSGDVWKVEDIAKKWGNASTRPCWVRVRGESGERLASCAVALEKPGVLKEYAEETVSVSWKMFWGTLCLAVLCTGMFAASAYATVSVVANNNREQREREGGAQQESLMSNQ